MLKFFARHQQIQRLQQPRAAEMLRQAKLLLKVQAAWPEEVHPAPGADLELEGFVPQEDLELLKRVYLHKEGLENIAQDLGTTRTALAKRVSRIKEKFRKNYRESEKNLEPEKKFGPRPGKNAPCRT